MLASAAVGITNGLVRLFLAENNAVDHRLADPEGTRRSIEVMAVRLDTYFGEKGTVPDLIKMDIQGAEAGAVKTLGPLAEQNPALILVTEFWPYGLLLHGSDPKEMLRDLTCQGFHLSELDERRRTVRPVNTETLLSRYTGENRRHTNLLCRRPGNSS